MPRSSTPDLRKYTPAQLEALISKAQKRKHDLTTRKADRVRARIQAILKAEGLTLGQVFGSQAAPAATRAKAKPAKYVVKPKYRNPDDATQTWSGRGKQPRWFSAQLASGRTRDDLLIG